LSINQGELKEDPIAGANLLRRIRTKENGEAVKKEIIVALKRIGIELSDVRKDIRIMNYEL
jgi:hypothetical protein